MGSRGSRCRSHHSQSRAYRAVQAPKAVTLAAVFHTRWTATHKSFAQPVRPIKVNRLCRWINLGQQPVAEALDARALEMLRRVYEVIIDSEI